MRILIAEDDAIMRRTVERLSQKLGHEPILTANGDDAWEAWKSNRPRIVIADWVMPGIDGLDLCRRIRATEGSQYTYIIMVTAKSKVDDIVTSMDAGADDFISKPISLEELAVRIRAGIRILGIESRDLVIFSLAKLAESRDPETGNHLERIRHYSRVLAETIHASGALPEEVDQAFIDSVFLTSPLHDIGKIGIPDYVLLKSGPYSEAEFSIMKDHCRIGYETLAEVLAQYSQAGYLRMSAEIALSHHERFDGTGYPDGLKGTEIPLAARIVTLSDVYDALVNRRVYKEAFNLSTAREMIIQERGLHFDPMVVDAFLTCEDGFVEIFRRYANG